MPILSSRPLPYGEFADPVGLVDSVIGLNWGPLELGLEVHNLLDDQYAANEFNFVSSWHPGELQPRTPARHLAAGAPRSWRISLGVTL